jgi:hypothetical protein
VGNCAKFPCGGGEAQSIPACSAQDWRGALAVANSGELSRKPVGSQRHNAIVDIARNLIQAGLLGKLNS